MRALLSVYDKEGLVELAQGLSELGWELVASGNTAAKLSEAGIAHIEVARGDRLARDAGRAGQDPPSQDPRRHPRRPLQARAPRRPGRQRDRGHRPGGVEPLSVLLRPLGRVDRHRRPGHGPRRGQEPRARRHRHFARRLPGRARGAARPPVRSRRRHAAGSPVPPSPTPPPTTPPSSPGSTPAAPRPSAASGRHHRRRRGSRAVRGAPADVAPDARAHRGRCATARTRTSRGSRYRIGGDDQLVGRHGPARGQPAVLPQHLRRRRGLAAGARAGSAPARAERAVAIIKHANPCGAAVADEPRVPPTSGPSSAIPSAPSAAWSPSAAT